MLKPQETVLVLVDLQARLVPAMHEREALIQSAVRLVRGAQVLEVPILHTEQNPAGLGPTVEEVASLLTGSPLTKRAFSCCGEQDFLDALQSLGRRRVLLAGIETHVCVYQTAVDLLAAGYDVQVVGDVVSSRTQANRAVGLNRMAAAGAGVTSVETALFELLGRAEGPKFKEILAIVK